VQGDKQRPARLLPARALLTWLHLYNHHRRHTATDGPPINRVSNLIGHYS
jgi:hypothetical protein